MSRAPHGRCSCGVNLLPDRTCRHGCHALKRPHRSRLEEEARTERRVAAALRADAMPSAAEVKRAADAAYPGSAAGASWRRSRFRF